MIDMTDRHPSTQQIARYFAWQHLPPMLADVSRMAHDLAEDWIITLPDGPELTVALRKLLEAKDCAVRAALDAKPSPAEAAAAGAALRLADDAKASARSAVDIDAAVTGDDIA